MLDVFRVSASADATMATWGGSTVDNLESITEDDDGQRGGTNMEEEEDDGKLVSLGRENLDDLCDKTLMQAL